MALKASDIPDFDITQAASNSRGLYYTCGKHVTVVSFKNRADVYVFLCLTCIQTDGCAHTRAVRRYCGHPLQRAYADDAA